jgi:hypothetical protein
MAGGMSGVLTRQRKLLFVLYQAEGPLLNMDHTHTRRHARTRASPQTQRLQNILYYMKDPVGSKLIHAITYFYSKRKSRWIKENK